MKRVITFNITQDKDTGFFTAEGFDLPVVTQGKSLDELSKNLKEAVELHLEGENLEELEIEFNPSILANFEIQTQMNA